MNSHQNLNVASNKNFKVAVYVPARDVQKMKDMQWLKSTYTLLSRYVHIDKVYLEVSRDNVIVDEKVILKAKEFFHVREAKIGTATIKSLTKFYLLTFTF